MPEFHQTQFGHIFFNSQLPSLVRNLGRIADCMEEEQQKQETSKEPGPLEGVDPDYIQALVDSVNTAAGKMVVETITDSDYWMGTVLTTAGGSQGRWERYYFRSDGMDAVIERMNQMFPKAFGVYVEAVDYEIDTEWDILDLTDGKADE